MDKDRILALDTETTGVGPNAEILQLSVIDGEGAVRMNQYFRPKKNSSWPEAEKVNHISPAMVSKCPFILDHKEEIQEMLGNAETIVGYNLPFDVQMLGVDPGVDKALSGAALGLGDLVLVVREEQIDPAEM